MYDRLSPFFFDIFRVCRLRSVNEEFCRFQTQIRYEYKQICSIVMFVIKNRVYLANLKQIPTDINFSINKISYHNMSIMHQAYDIRRQ